MSPGVEFPAPEVLRHAAAVDEAADRMTQARSAVDEVTMDSQAYGQLCQFLPAFLTPLFVTAAGAMNDAVDALGETALKLRATAMAMEGTDVRSAELLNGDGGPGLALPL